MRDATTRFLEKVEADHMADHAYARWAVDNEPQSFPAPHVIEHTSFMAGYKIARADLLALLKRAEAALEPYCKVAPYVTSIAQDNYRRAASVLSDLRDVLKEQA